MPLFDALQIGLAVTAVVVALVGFLDSRRHAARTKVAAEMVQALQTQTAALVRWVSSRRIG